MSNPTSNFGWQMPTATDLVTDLPADFEVFGQAVDTDFVDLLGGTTGQILSKASATDLDFTWVTSAPGDIEGVTAGIGISGGGTSGTVTVTNSMATAIDAKGDLVAGTGADAFARIAIGANATVLTADSAEITGMKWAAAAAPSYTWTSYTPTITSQGGSITTYTATGKYLTVGKGVFFIFNITLTTVGTATGNLITSLPVNSIGASVGSVYESNNTGTSGVVSIAGNSAISISRNYAGTSWFNNGAVLVGSIYYEVA